MWTVPQAWKLVKPTTIQNCWRHTGILHKPPTITSEDDLPLSSLTHPGDDLPLSKLRTLIQQISPDADITPEDYINMDSDVATEQKLQWI